MPNGEDRYFWPSNPEIGVMLGILGTPGMGKTQLLESVLLDLSFAPSANQAAPSALVLDIKGDFSQDESFLKAAKFEVFSIRDLPFSFWTLPEGQKNYEGSVAKTYQFIGTLKRLYPGVGPVQQSYLTDAIIGSYQRSNYETPSFRDIATAYQSTHPKSTDSVDSLFKRFTLLGVFENSASPETSIHEFLDSGRLVIDFSPLEEFSDDSLKSLFANFILDAYVQNMQIRYNPTSTNYVAHEDLTLRTLFSYLIIDEAHQVMKLEPQTLDKLQRQGRSFGFGVILASQEMREWKQPSVDYRDLIDNWLIFRMNTPAAADLRAVGLSNEEVSTWQSQITSLARGEAISVTRGQGISVVKIVAEAMYKRLES
jgi:DNA helicase HerA-like ATPase